MDPQSSPFGPRLSAHLAGKQGLATGWHKKVGFGAQAFEFVGTERAFKDPFGLRGVIESLYYSADPEARIFKKPLSHFQSTFPGGGTSAGLHQAGQVSIPTFSAHSAMLRNRSNAGWRNWRGPGLKKHFQAAYIDTLAHEVGHGFDYFAAGPTKFNETFYDRASRESQIKWRYRVDERSKGKMGKAPTPEWLTHRLYSRRVSEVVANIHAGSLIQFGLGMKPYPLEEVGLLKDYPAVHKRLYAMERTGLDYLQPARRIAGLLAGEAKNYGMLKRRWAYKARANVIKGFNAKGMAAALRKVMTPFGSPFDNSRVVTGGLNIPGSNVLMAGETMFWSPSNKGLVRPGLLVPPRDVSILRPEMLAMENIFEEVRAQRFPHLPSRIGRQTRFLSPYLGGLFTPRKGWRGQGNFAARVTGKVFFADAEFVTEAVLGAQRGDITGVRGWAERYWRGLTPVPGPEPEFFKDTIEAVVHGEAIVRGKIKVGRRNPRFPSRNLKFRLSRADPIERSLRKRAISKGRYNIIKGFPVKGIAAKLRSILTPWASPTNNLKVVLNEGILKRFTGFLSVGSRKGQAYSAALRAAEGKHGVYLIEGKRPGEILYIGHSGTGRLFETMTRHFQKWDLSRRGGAAGNVAFRRRDVRAGFITTKTKEQAKALEAALIRIAEPRWNTDIPLLGVETTMPYLSRKGWRHFRDIQRVSIQRLYSGGAGDIATRRWAEKERYRLIDGFDAKGVAGALRRVLMVASTPKPQWTPSPGALPAATRRTHGALSRAFNIPSYRARIGRAVAGRLAVTSFGGRAIAEALRTIGDFSAKHKERFYQGKGGTVQWLYANRSKSGIRARSKNYDLGTGPPPSRTPRSHPARSRSGVI